MNNSITMKKRTLAIVFALLLAGGLAKANIISDFNIGNENQLHVEFAFTWGANDPLGSISGGWEGGSYTFSGNIFVLRPSSTLEMVQDFWLQTYWNDGWTPGGLGTHQTAAVREGAFNFPLFSGEGPQDPYPDYSGNNLQYHLSASATQQATVFGTTTGSGGQGLVTYNISRTPFSVPDTGSTLLLLSMSLAGLLIVSRASRFGSASGGDSPQCLRESSPSQA